MTLSSSQQCPACGCNSSFLVEQLQTDSIVWKMAEHIDRTFSLQSIAQAVSESLKTQQSEGYPIYQCRECALEFTPVADIVTDIYAKLYVQNSYSERWEFQKTLELIQAKTYASVFEIGCGSGIFLSKLTQQNISCAGIDLSLKAIQAGLSKNLKVDNAGIEDIGQCLSKLLNRQQVDAIALFHVFEHLPDPAKFLSLLSQHLSASGSIFISVPSPIRAQRILGNLEGFDYPPHHLTRWTEAAFQAVAKQANLRVAEIFYQPIAEQMLKKQIARSQVYSSALWQSIDRLIRVPVVARQDTNWLQRLGILARQLFIFLCLKLLGSAEPINIQKVSGESMLIVLTKLEQL